MTEPNSFPQKLSFVLSDMESNVYDIRRWAQVLIVMSGSCHSVQPDTLSPIANALHDLGTSLEEQYDRAHALAHPQAEQPGGKPCA